MLSKYWRKVILTYSVILAELVLISAPFAGPASLAQGEPGYVRRVRAIETANVDVASPAGLAFWHGGDAFYVVQARGPGQPAPDPTDIHMVTSIEERGASARIAAALSDPINMAFDKKRNRLLILQPRPNKLVEVSVRADGSLDPATLIRHDGRSFDLGDPQGMAVDPQAHRRCESKRTPRPARRHHLVRAA